MHSLFDNRTRKIFGVLMQIQEVFGCYVFDKEEHIYSVRVESIDNDDEIRTYIYLYYEPYGGFTQHLVISQDQLAMFSGDFDNSLVLEHWIDGKVNHRQSCRHVSNDRNFAFLLYLCEHWVMVEKRNRKKVRQDNMMKKYAQKLETYFKKRIG